MLQYFQRISIPLLLLTAPASARDVVIEKEMVHLRSGTQREWSDFPETNLKQGLERTFQARANQKPATLRIRHRDVKQDWQVVLNGRQLGRLRLNENEMVEYFAVPADLLRGENTLSITAQNASRPSDDIMVGDIVLHDTDTAALLSRTRVRVTVVGDADTPIPSRLTITNSEGALQSVNAKSDKHLAVRPGVVYTSNGRAEFGLPTGTYTVTASRGFEYSVATQKIETDSSDVSIRLRIRREVPTEGYVACDTHVHSRTHSGHGDSTVQERMITLAAEGVELPIATDHNVQIDHRPFAQQAGVVQYFTPVIGNEVTTSIGHFNIWPVRPGAAVPDHTLKDWGAIGDSIFSTDGVQISILNHARDLHGGTRPFGPRLHNSAAGQNLEDWPVRFNGMEVLNSGATQTDVMQLFHDWMGLLNAGHSVTPVGSSDSHDVARYIVGQGRTYVRCDDRAPGKINVTAAAEAFVRGEVLVSYGLLCEMVVNNRHRSGALVAPADKNDDSRTVNVRVRVLGPHWTTADQLTLFANGAPVRTTEIQPPGQRANGVIADQEWTLEVPAHDVHLVAIATGPGISSLHWNTAKPYQPDSTDWSPRVIGCSGAVWIDSDRDDRPTPAISYARRVVAENDGDLARALDALTTYDQAVAIQAAHLLQRSGVPILSDETQRVVRRAPPHVRAGFDLYRQQWRDNQVARAQARK